MAFARQPLTNSYSLILRNDPAVNRDLPDFEHEWQVASETLEWRRVLKPGEEATEFICRPIAPIPWRAFVDRYTEIKTLTNQRTGEPVETRLPTAIGAALLVLLGVHQVKNWDGVEIKRQAQRDYPDLGPLANPSLLDALDAIDKDDNRPVGESTGELATVIYLRQLLAPKR